MPTKLPRVSVTLKPETHSVLVNLSEVTGNSVSSLIADVMNDSMPVFERMLRVIKTAEQAKAMAKEGVRRSLEEAQGRIEAGLLSAIEDLNVLELEIGQTVGGDQDAPEGGVLIDFTAAVDDCLAPFGGPAGSGGDGSTPISNRGVRFTTPRTKVHKKGA